MRKLPDMNDAINIRATTFAPQHTPPFDSLHKAANSLLEQSMSGTISLSAPEFACILNTIHDLRERVKELEGSKE